MLICFVIFIIGSNFKDVHSDIARDIDINNLFDIFEYTDGEVDDILNKISSGDVLSQDADILQLLNQQELSIGGSQTGEGNASLTSNVTPAVASQYDNSSVAPVTADQNNSSLIKLADEGRSTEQKALDQKNFKFTVSKKDYNAVKRALKDSLQKLKEYCKRHQKNICKRISHSSNNNNYEHRSYHKCAHGRCFTSSHERHKKRCKETSAQCRAYLESVDAGVLPETNPCLPQCDYQNYLSATQYPEVYATNPVTYPTQLQAMESPASDESQWIYPNPSIMSKISELLKKREPYVAEPSAANYQNTGMNCQESPYTNCATQVLMPQNDAMSGLQVNCPQLPGCDSVAPPCANILQPCSLSTTTIFPINTAPRPTVAPVPEPTTVRRIRPRKTTVKPTKPPKKTTTVRSTRRRKTTVQSTRPPTKTTTVKSTRPRKTTVKSTTTVRSTRPQKNTVKSTRPPKRTTPVKSTRPHTTTVKSPRPPKRTTTARPAPSPKAKSTTTARPIHSHTTAVKPTRSPATSRAPAKVKTPKTTIATTYYPVYTLPTRYPHIIPMTEPINSYDFTTVPYTQPAIRTRMPIRGRKTTKKFTAMSTEAPFVMTQAPVVTEAPLTITETERRATNAPEPTRTLKITTAAPTRPQVTTKRAATSAPEPTRTVKMTTKPAPTMPQVTTKRPTTRAPEPTRTAKMTTKTAPTKPQVTTKRQTASSREPARTTKMTTKAAPATPQVTTKRATTRAPEPTRTTKMTTKTAPTTPQVTTTSVTTRAPEPTRTTKMTTKTAPTTPQVTTTSVTTRAPEPTRTTKMTTKTAPTTPQVTTKTATTRAPEPTRTTKMTTKSAPTKPQVTTKSAPTKPRVTTTGVTTSSPTKPKVTTKRETTTVSTMKATGNATTAPPKQTTGNATTAPPKQTTANATTAHHKQTTGNAIASPLKQTTGNAKTTPQKQNTRILTTTTSNQKMGNPTTIAPPKQTTRMATDIAPQTIATDISPGPMTSNIMTTNTPRLQPFSYIELPEDENELYSKYNRRSYETGRSSISKLLGRQDSFPDSVIDQPNDEPLLESEPEVTHFSRISATTEAIKNVVHEVNEYEGNRWKDTHLSDIQGKLKSPTIKDCSSTGEDCINIKGKNYTLPEEITCDGIDCNGRENSKYTFSKNCIEDLLNVNLANKDNISSDHECERNLMYHMIQRNIPFSLLDYVGRKIIQSNTCSISEKQIYELNRLTRFLNKNNCCNSEGSFIYLGGGCQ